jgi:hypothetical protein
MPLYLIKEISNIEDKSYLELGTLNGSHLMSVPCKTKAGVDINASGTFQGTTDEYFSQLDDSIKFDVIYIDADHHHESIRKDFNNAVKRLEEGGCIFLHDLFPETEELTAPHYCGTGYIFLDALLRLKIPGVYTLNEDHGQTFVFSPKVTVPKEALRPSLSYKDFRLEYKDHHLYNKKELETIVRQAYEEKKTEENPHA